MRAAHRGRHQIGPQPEHRVGVRPRADRAGPELDRDRVIVDHADADRPFEPARQVDGERTRRLDDLRDALMAGGQLVHPAGDAIAAAHVVARHVAFGRERLEDAHDGRLGKSRLLVDGMHRCDAQLVDGAQHAERAADRPAPADRTAAPDRSRRAANWCGSGPACSVSAWHDEAPARSKAPASRWCGYAPTRRLLHQPAWRILPFGAVFLFAAARRSLARS